MVMAYSSFENERIWIFYRVHHAVFCFAAVDLACVWSADMNEAQGILRWGMKCAEIEVAGRR